MTEASALTSLRVALVGAGRVGTAVAMTLKACDHAIVAVASRTRSSAEQAAGVLGDPPVFSLPGESLPRADVVLLGVPGDSLASVARDVSPLVDPGAAVIHFAGAFGIEPLAAIERRGGRPLALHPVQVFPDAFGGLARLPGSAWGVTCRSEELAWARRFVERELAGVPVEVAEDDRPLWHAAAVIVSNGTAALLAAGEQLLSSIGIEAPREVLGPLAAGTLANARQSGGATTLTGPAVRAEVATIRRHVSAIRSRAPQLSSSYELVTRSIVESAAVGGRIDERSRAAVLEALER